MSDSEIKHKLTTKEAVAFVKKAPAGVRFALHAGVSLPVVSNDTHIFYGSTYVNISRKDALRIVEDLVSEVWEACGARVPITVRTYTGQFSGTTTTTYWIG